jgi:hypothetical protein
MLFHIKKVNKQNVILLEDLLNHTEFQGCPYNCASVAPTTEVGKTAMLVIPVPRSTKVR